MRLKRIVLFTLPSTWLFGFCNLRLTSSLRRLYLRAEKYAKVLIYMRPNIPVQNYKKTTNNKIINNLLGNTATIWKWL